MNREIILYKRKGIVFSLDIFLAIILVIFVTFFILVNIGQTSIDYDEIFLHKTAVDSLSVLREDNSLETLDDDAIRGFIDGLPEQICANVTVYDSGGIITYNRVKAGCLEEGEIKGISRRVFLSSDGAYMGEVKTWHE